ncbi:murein biosynthesis integral membrane protein MurJ [Candidatus Dependentiae bacterium]|nr:murein biosynthesis integral membrane protein MurJ [Candidatus Dependentiae bacterium]
MQKSLSKKSILKKTVAVGGSTLLSRILGLVRTIFETRYLGAGALSDAFLVAYKVPNFLRKIFAEGALSAAIMPRLVLLAKEKEYNQISKLITLMLMIIEALLFAVCLLVVAFPQPIVLFTAPGFAAKPVELASAVALLRILMFFVFFISSSALLSGALQAVHHFAIPAFSPALLNIIYIAGLSLCWYFKLPVPYLAFFVLLGGLLQLLLHLYMYFKLNFTFARPDKTTYSIFRAIMFKFLPCIVTMSAMEISLYIDSQFASYLPEGSISLVTYASRFMGIPLGIFGAAFSTILLPHFSRISSYAPKRLSFYLFESTKLIIYLTLPALILMGYFSYEIFFTLFKNFSLSQVHESAWLLRLFLSGLFFFSINKILLSLYYSLNNTLLPTLITLTATVGNTLFNWFFIGFLGSYGLALGTALSGLIQTVLFFWILRAKFNFTLYWGALARFFTHYMLQLGSLTTVFFIVYKLILTAIKTLPATYVHLLLDTVGLWFWVGPLSLAFFGLLYITRSQFGIKLYFLD